MADSAGLIDGCMYYNYNYSIKIISHGVYRIFSLNSPTRLLASALPRQTTHRSHLHGQPQRPRTALSQRRYTFRVSDFDANLAVSEETTQWSAVHLCCRFDAVCCLDFLLKRTYVANVKRYIGAVNARTSEGLSPLHLCGTWAAFKCFFLLLRYGGANLSALDGRSRTP